MQRSGSNCSILSTVASARGLIRINIQLRRSWDKKADGCRRNKSTWRQDSGTVGRSCVEISEQHSLPLLAGSQYWNYFTFAKFRNVGTTPSATIKGYSWLSCVQKSNSREINYFYTTFFYTFCKQKLSPAILCVARQHVWGLCFKTSSGSQYWNYFTFVQSS